MNNDLVKWLRTIRSPFAGQALDLIEQQQAEIDQLRELLKHHKPDCPRNSHYDRKLYGNYTDSQCICGLPELPGESDNG